MRRTLLGALAAVTLAFGAAEPAKAQQTATVTAHSVPGGVAVTWRLEDPTTIAVFLDTSIIRTRWTMATSGLVLTDGAVRSERSFDTFEILIAPDEAEVDRVYMGLARVGDGYVLYGPGLALENADVALTLESASGETTLPASNAIDGYAYIGPDSAVRRQDGGAVVVGANVPVSLSTLMSDGFLSAQTFYGARLGRDLPYQPVLIVTTDSPGPTTFRGDVTDTGIIATRFYGTSWDAPPEDVVGQLSTFVWHETLHLWNGHGVRLKDGETAPWLHEGGAEYGALVAAVSSGVIDEAELNSSLERRLNGCRSELGDRAYDAGLQRSSGTIYNCGVLIQWLADLEVRRSSGGRRDIFDLWKAMLDAGRAGDGYGAEDFLDRLSQESSVNLLLDGSQTDRWSDIEARLAALGVTLRNDPGRSDYRRAALSHLNGQNCAEDASGFSNTSDGIRLDTGDKCGVLSGAPVLTSVEEFDPWADANAMFFAVQTRCAQSLPIRIRFQDGRGVEAVCDALLAAPEAWVIATAPPLTTRSR